MNQNQEHDDELGEVSIFPCGACRAAGLETESTVTAIVDVPDAAIRTRRCECGNEFKTRETASEDSQ